MLYILHTQCTHAYKTEHMHKDTQNCLSPFIQVCVWGSDQNFNPSPRIQKVIDGCHIYLFFILSRFAIPQLSFFTLLSLRLYVFSVCLFAPCLALSVRVFLPAQYVYLSPQCRLSVL